jgi:hypothetical protein
VPPEARYANYFSVGHAGCEVVLEFGQYYEGDAEPAPHTRIITSPINAVRLVELLQESLSQYAAQHGPILPKSSEGA